ncbi:uncharacterized protein LOC135399024 [Ornithodoros turicata]|uniref:uncharacterized protein LOC135399024 n=1 Tax=Ornithodoros turicata TaxID=34597 RepID=UPI00313938A4
MDEADDSNDVVEVILPLSSINHFVGSTCDSSRCLLEGENVFEAKHVVECGLTSWVNPYTFLAYVLPTSNLAGDPHKVTFTIKERHVENASCSCKAGAHKCKHIVAALLRVNTERKFSKLSKTDVEQAWGKQSSAKARTLYVPRRAVELPCAKQYPKTSIPLPKGNILQRLLKGVKYLCAAKVHLKGESNRTYVPAHIQPEVTTVSEDPSTKVQDPQPPTLQETIRTLTCLHPDYSVEEIYRKIEEMYAVDDFKKIEEITRAQSKSEAWKSYRVGMITGSVGYNVFTRVKTILTRIGEHNVAPTVSLLMRQKSAVTGPMARGSALEEEAKVAFIRVNSTMHKSLSINSCGLFVMKSHPYIGASPDGIITCSCCPPRLIEIKCPLEISEFTKRELTSNNEHYQFKATSKYNCQVQLQMNIAGLSSTEIFIYKSAEEYVQFTVTVDSVYFQECVNRFSYFFRCYVLPFILGSPELTATCKKPVDFSRGLPQGLLHDFLTFK